MRLCKTNDDEKVTKRTEKNDARAQVNYQLSTILEQSKCRMKNSEYQYNNILIIYTKTGLSQRSTWCVNSM